MSPDHSDLSIAALALYLTNALQKRLHEGYKAAGFTDIRPAHDLVFGLLSSEGDRIVDLARKANTTKQAMGYHIAHLEELGYLARQTDPSDKRAYIIQRTPKGWAAQNAAREVIQQLEAEWAEQFGADQMAELLNLLRGLVRALNLDHADAASDNHDHPAA